MSNKQFEKLVTNLQGIMRCPHCSGSYELSDIHYLGQMDTMTFLHMRCEGCKTPVFASVALTNEEGEIMASDIAADQINIQSTLGSEPTEVPTEEPELNFSHKQLDLATDIPVEDISVNQLLETALSPVSYNDVLDIHQYLDNFGGDFETTFGTV